MNRKYTLLILLILIFTTSLNSIIYSQLSGNYIIGTGGNYQNISDAVNDLNLFRFRWKDEAQLLLLRLIVRQA